ncbi:MAG TPA: hypothetical protein P5543_09900 [Planctomycetota bacterium]|nr:hypothetical protein [Planctomycetota bacterium]
MNRKKCGELRKMRGFPLLWGMESCSVEANLLWGNIKRDGFKNRPFLCYDFRILS